MEKMHGNSLRVLRIEKDVTRIVTLCSTLSSNKGSQKVLVPLCMYGFFVVKFFSLLYPKGINTSCLSLKKHF